MRRKSSAVYGSTLDLVETELLVNSAQAEGEKLFFERLDIELNKVIEFYKTKEKEFLQHADILDEQMHSLFELKLVVENRKAFAAHRRRTDDEDLITSLTGDDSRTTLLNDGTVNRNMDPCIVCLFITKIRLYFHSAKFCNHDTVDLRHLLVYCCFLSNMLRGNIPLALLSL